MGSPSSRTSARVHSPRVVRGAELGRRLARPSSNERPLRTNERPPREEGQGGARGERRNAGRVARKEAPGGKRRRAARWASSGRVDDDADDAGRLIRATVEPSHVARQMQARAGSTQPRYVRRRWLSSWEGEGGRGREGRARCCDGAHHVASRDVRWASTAASGASGEPCCTA